MEKIKKMAMRRSLNRLKALRPRLSESDFFCVLWLVGHVGSVKA